MTKHKPHMIQSWKYLFCMTLTVSANVLADDFAEIPDFNPNTSTMMIGSVRSLSTKTTGKYGDISLDQSNGQLAIVDNVDSPSCVAFLQLSDNATNSSQSLAADTINLNCH